MPLRLRSVLKVLWVFLQLPAAEKQIKSHTWKKLASWWTLQHIKCSSFQCLTFLLCVSQVTALVKLKECEDTHLGEEVDRNWSEVVTQQYVFDRLNREVRTITCVFLAAFETHFHECRIF